MSTSDDALIDPEATGSVPPPPDASPEAPPAPAGDGAGPEEAETADAVESDISELAQLIQERDEYLDSLRRLQADFENFKKRVVRQQTEHLERAAEDIVVKLLPVLDAADLAIAHGGGEAVAQVGGMLMDTLTKDGLEGIAPEPGSSFDPTVHDAVAHEEGDGPPEIVDVMRAGYRWKGKLLRAAMVRVKGS